MRIHNIYRDKIATLSLTFIVYIRESSHIVSKQASANTIRTGICTALVEPDSVILIQWRIVICRIYSLFIIRHVYLGACVTVYVYCYLLYSFILFYTHVYVYKGYNLVRNKKRNICNNWCNRYTQRKGRVIILYVNFYIPLFIPSPTHIHNNFSNFNQQLTINNVSIYARNLFIYWR